MISIRKLTMEDSVTTFAYSSDAENVFYMLNSPFLTLEETVKFLAKCIAEYKKEKPKYLSYAVIYEGVPVIIHEPGCGRIDDFLSLREQKRLNAVRELLLANAKQD